MMPSTIFVESLSLQTYR